MNFCSSAFSTKVYSSCPSSDGFEVENLLSEKKSLKGFQAESFASTPIHISLQLPLPIHLKQVSLMPYIGQQCAKLLHLSVLRVSRTSKEFVDCDDIKCRVGSVTLECPSHVCFLNHTYENHEPEGSSGFAMQPSAFVVNMAADLKNVIAIKISIISMLTGSVPSVRNLQVWGRPSRICNKIDRNKCVEAWLKHNDCTRSRDCDGDVIIKEDIVASCSSSSKSTTISSKELCETNVTLNIPNSFIDPLMCTVMRNPVLLPSGHSIDQTTLDKHVISQSEWGRLPSDPFTGIVFNEKYKPTPDVNLKVRLDKYLLDQSENTFSPTPSTKPEVFDTFSNRTKPDISSTACASVILTDVAATSDEILHSFPTQSTSDKNRNHRKRPMESSLDDALSRAKTRLAKFRTLKPPTSAGNVLHCGKCNVFLSSLVTQYKLPCKHRLCRSCLFSMKTSATLECPSCDVTFSHNQVTRSYV